MLPKLWLLSLCIVLAPVAMAQSTPNQPGTGDSKPKHVWTNEDVQQLKGPVNVVGEPSKPAKASGVAKSDSPAKDANTKPPIPKKDAEVCASDAWASGVDIMLTTWDVNLGKKFWAERLFNELCITPVVVSEAALRLKGDYVLDDGKKIRVNTDVVLKDFPSPTMIVDATLHNHPFLVSWKSRPLIATHVDYTENYYNGVLQDYTITKLYLTDPLSGETVVYDPTIDKLKEIEGALLVAVMPRR